MSTSKLTHSGNILLIGFGGMLVMMSLLVYLSLKQDVSMVSNNYYEQELVYQDKIDAMNNTNKYDAEFSATINDKTAEIQLPVALSQNITEGKVVFYCPAAPGMDRSEKLSPREDGLYIFPLSELPGKGYVAKISLQSDGVAYYKELKLSEQR